MKASKGILKIRPVIASLLSLIVPGLGHVYLDRVVTGLSLVVAHVSLGALATITIMAGLTSTLGVVLVATPWCLLWIASAVWAYRSACVLSCDPLPRKQYPTYLYLLIGLLALPNAAGWALAIRANVAEVFYIPSRSMIPGIAPGSRVLVDKLAYRRTGLKRGERVVFTNPNARHERYIKRVVALPGDVIEMQNDELSINSKRLGYEDRSPTSGPISTQRIEQNGGARYRILLGSDESQKGAVTSFGPLRVPNGHCFVLGDNRHQSEDSRTHGVVPLQDVIGRVARVF